jgi:hypothetical protein
MGHYIMPPYSKVDTSNPFFHYTCEPRYGQVIIERILALDKNDDIARDATVVDPQTGLWVLNLTAQLLMDNTKFLFDIMVQDKSVPINVTYAENGTTWQMPGILALFTDSDLDLNRVGLYFVDHTTGYYIRVNGPSETPEPIFSDEPVTPDPRGDSIPIHGIGLNNLPPVMAEPLKIINSVSLTRR